MQRLRYENYSLIILLASLLFIFLVYPFFGGLPDSKIFLKLLISIVLVAAVIATTHKVLHLVIASCLAFFAILTSWGEIFYDTQVWVALNLVLNIVFIGYVIWVHLVKIMTTKEVTKNLLYGAICIYMLIGLMMSFVFILIDLYVPNSFIIAISPITNGSFAVEQHFFRYVYYSFVTLTTLGYGDIRPLSQPAQAFSYMEAIAGQFYLTVLVARLIGLYLSKNK